MYLKKCEILGLSCLFAASVACGAEASLVSESFETTETDITKLTSANWDGYGAIEAAPEGTSGDYPAYSGVAGRPLTGGHTKVLRVDGYVTCAPTTAMTSGDSAQVDMMVQAALPDEALAIPDGEENKEQIQIAVGVDKGTDEAGVLKVYCKNKSGTAGWYELMGVTKDQWYRVSFIFDYANGRCQVRVDGQPIMTANGYLRATTAAGDTAAGAWYTLNYTTNTRLASVKVIGTTALDDMLVQTGTAGSPLPALPIPEDTTDANLEGAVTGIAVPLSWYDRYGVAWKGDAKYDNSGLKAAEKYELGLTPFDNVKFEVKTMKMDENGATFTIPKVKPIAGKKLVLKYAGNANFENAQSTDVAAEQESVTIGTLPEGNVIYYRLETVTE